MRRDRADWLTPRAGVCNSSRPVSSPSAPASTAGSSRDRHPSAAVDPPPRGRLRVRLRRARPVLRRRPAAAPTPGRDVIARVHAGPPRATPALAALLAAQQRAREAPRRPRGRRGGLRRSRPPSRSSPASRPGSSAARSTRCTRPHRHQAGPPGHRRARRAGRAGLLDRLRRPRLGRSAALHGARRRAARRTRSRSADARRRRRAADRPADARRPGARPPSTRSQAVLPPTEFTADLLAHAARRLRARPRHVGGVRRACSSTCSARYGLVVYDAADPAAKPLAASAVRARAGRRPAAPRQLAADAGAAPRGARLPRAGRPPASDAAPLFLIDGSRQAIRWRDGTAVVGDREMPLGRTRGAGRRRIPSASARTCCCGRSCRTRSSRPSVTWAVRASWRISASCASVYAHFGVPMPLVDAARVGHRGRLGDAALPRQARRRRSPRFQRQDELTLNQLLESQLPAGGRDAASPTPRAAIAERLEAVTAAATRRRRDARRRGASRRSARCSTTCRRCTARSCTPPRRRTRRCAASSPGRRRQLFPNGQPQEREIGAGVAAQPLRPGRRRPPDRAAAARPRPSLGAHDLSRSGSVQRLAVGGCRAAGAGTAWLPRRRGRGRCCRSSLPSRRRRRRLLLRPALAGSSTRGCTASACGSIPRVYGRPLDAARGPDPERAPTSSQRLNDLGYAEREHGRASPASSPSARDAVALVPRGGDYAGHTCCASSGRRRLRPPPAGHRAAAATAAHRAAARRRARA